MPALISELIGTQLAEWFGLPTFEFGLMTVSDSELYPDRADLTSPMTAFVTREEEGEKWQGSAEELKSIVNAKDISRLVIFRYVGWKLRSLFDANACWRRSRT